MLALKIKVVALKRTMIIIIMLPVYLSKIIFFAGSVDMDKVHYCERFLELLVDLEVNTMLIIDA